MSRRKTLRKNYSKKANRRKNATKRKRVGGRWFFNQAKKSPVTSASVRLTETTPPVFQPTIDTIIAKYVSNLPNHIELIKDSAKELEEIYNDYPELFDKIRDGYKRYATAESFHKDYKDNYDRDYEDYLKSLIRELPDKDIEHYSEKEKNNTLNTLASINLRSRQFKENISLDKSVSGNEFDETEEENFERFIRALKRIIYLSNPYIDLKID